MYLSKEQLEKLLGIIDEIHHVFIANYLTPAVLPKPVLNQLKRAGVLAPKIEGVRDAYRYGLLAANLPAEDQGSSGPTYEQVKAKLKRDPMPLSAVERQAIRSAEMMAGQYISGIGERIKTDVTQRVMESDKNSRAADRKAYRETVAHGLAQRRSNRQVASDLGHRTQDWTRDLERVANTELSDAMQQATAQEAGKKGGKRARVAKVFANACCFRPEARVETASGTKRIGDVQVGEMVLTHRLRYRRVMAIQRRYYLGPLYGLNGEDAAATPEHPMLVDGGWRRVDTVQQGSHIVRLVGRVEPHDEPSLAAQARLLHAVSAQHSAPAVPATAVQLYGHLLGLESNVDVEAAHRESKNWQIGAQAMCEVTGLGGAHMQRLLASLGGADQGHFARLFAATRSGSGGASGSLFSRRASLPKGVLLRAAPHRRIGILKAFLDAARAYGKQLCDVFEASFRLCVCPYHGGGVESFVLAPCLAGSALLPLTPGGVAPAGRNLNPFLGQQASHFEAAQPHLSGNAADAQVLLGVESGGPWSLGGIASTAHSVQLQAVTKVVKQHYAGPVYNLTVEQDHSYFAEKMAVHNCANCRRHYGAGDGTDRPRIFFLEDLEANGTNVGRKAREWLPVIGPMHPSCRCTLVIVPRAMAFNSAGLMVPRSLADV